MSSALAAHGTELGRVAVQFVFGEPAMGKLAEHLDLSPCAASLGRLAFTPSPQQMIIINTTTGKWPHWVGGGETGKVGSVAHGPDHPLCFVVLLRARGLRGTC